MLNLTPHAITVRLPDGSEVTFHPSGQLARIETVETAAAPVDGIPSVYRRLTTPVGLPAEGVPCLVSAMVLGAVPGRAECYAPDTGATAIRNDAGHVVAVTRLVRA